MDNNSGESVDLIERARAGDHEALNALLTRHRDRLRRMVEMRLDTRLQARLDASHVVQEAYVEVAERLQEYLSDPKLPLFLWLRLVVGERLLRLHRHHLGTQSLRHFEELTAAERPKFSASRNPRRPNATSAHSSA